MKFVFVFERSILGVELVLEPPSFVCYCWRKRLDTVEIGWIQIGRASNTNDFYQKKLNSEIQKYKYKRLKKGFKIQIDIYKYKRFLRWRKRREKLAGFRLAVLQIQNRKTSKKIFMKKIKIQKYKCFYCWRKRLDMGKIGWIQTVRASNTKDL